MNYQHFLLFVFAILAYFIITDDSIAKVFYYVTNLIKNQYEIKKWWLLNNPSNPIVKYLIWRKSLKMAKDLEKEFQKNEKPS
jgi:hypothetical protein